MSKGTFDFDLNDSGYTVSDKLTVVKNKLSFLSPVFHKIQKTSYDFPLGLDYIVVTDNGDNTYDLIKYGGEEYNFSNGSISLDPTKATNEMGLMQRVPALNLRRGKLNLGDVVNVCFYDRSKQKPYIRNLLKRGNLTIREDNPPTPTGTGLWLRSYASATENALGSFISPAGLYRINPDTTATWVLPTSDNPSIQHAGIQAFGLGRFNGPNNSAPGETDSYASAWQYQVEADPGTHGWRIGTWATSNRVPLWSKDFGLVTDSGLVNPEFLKNFRFFIDNVSGWIHVIPDSSISFPGRIFSARSSTVARTSNISRGAGTLNLANISMHSYIETIGEEGFIESYMCCPATPETSAGGQASVDFLKMNQDTGEWTSFSSFDSAYIPEGGPTEVPDCLEFGSEHGGPVAWRDKEAVLFSSGGQRDLFDLTKWTKAHWSVRTIKTDGTEGVLLKSKTVEASESPTVLAHASLKSEALGADYTLKWDATDGWYGGIELASSDSSSDFAQFKDLAPILLPAQSPNTHRMGTVETAAAVDTGGTRRWPNDLKNCGGGVIVDEAKTIWFAVLEPEQFLYGGSYSYYVQEEQQATYLWYFTNSGCGGFGSLFGYSATEVHPIAPDDQPAAVTVGNPQFLIRPCTNGSEGDQTLTWSFDPDSPQDHPVRKFVWSQKPGWTWRTKLYGITITGELVEADISQRLDATHSAALGGAAAGPGQGFDFFTVTETDFLAPDNVWQLISFADKKLIAILRDLHADGPANNPSPHLEVWDTTSTPVKISTVRLGSYDELKSTDDFVNDAWKSGDQEWDPYAFGRPRMKACRGEDNRPVILVMVGENKKANPDTDSLFKRVCWATIEVANPAAPTVTRSARTSPDEGVGSSGDIDGNYPTWVDWDTLVLTPGKVAWTRNSNFYETTIIPQEIKLWLFMKMI